MCSPIDYKKIVEDIATIMHGGVWDIPLLSITVKAMRDRMPSNRDPSDYFAQLVTAARDHANKAMTKYPQPNYVLNKLSEEHGEVVRGIIHYTEGREDWSSVEIELIQNLAMLIRLVAEGDQVIGFTPPTANERMTVVSQVLPPIYTPKIPEERTIYPSIEAVELGIDDPDRFDWPGQPLFSFETPTGKTVTQFVVFDRKAVRFVLKTWRDDLIERVSPNDA